MNALSNRLPVLADAVRRAHAEVEAAERLTAQRAIEAGALLVEAKGLMKHGGWLPFLQETGIPERTAQRYMALARGRLESDTVTLLGGLIPALHFLRLRAFTTAQFNLAEKAALRLESGEEITDDELLRPIEMAMDGVDEMAAMFPPGAMA